MSGLGDNDIRKITTTTNTPTTVLRLQRCCFLQRSCRGGGGGGKLPVGEACPLRPADRTGATTAVTVIIHCISPVRNIVERRCQSAPSNTTTATTPGQGRGGGRGRGRAPWFFLL